MKLGMKVMEDLGFIETTDKQDRHEIVRQFTKHDDKGFATDIINYFYSIDGIDVFTNNLEYGCGIRLDKDILNAVIINFYELQEEMEQEK